jgi:hypothetical protein
MIENEPTQNPNPPPNWRKSIVRVIAVILGAALIAFPLHSILCSVLNLPSLPFSWIVLAIIVLIVLVRWRSWAKKSPVLSSSSLHQTGPKRRALFGGIALACGAAQLCCFGACYFYVHGRGANVGFSLFGIGFLLTFPALGCALLGMARREQPKWPAAVGGLIGASPFVIVLLAGFYKAALQPLIERARHAYLYDAPSETSSANSPSIGETPPVGAGKRISPDGRSQWCAEAQAAVESWLRADTNNLFTPKYGKFVRLEG